MFAVNNQPTTYKFTAPLEKHGQEPKSSTSLRFTLNLHSHVLAAFHTGLRDVLYRQAEAGEQPELPAEHPDGRTKLALPKLAPLQIDDILPGYGLGMTCGLDTADVQHFDQVKLSNFRLEPLNGGTVEVQVSAHFHPTPDQVAWIYDQQGKEVEISLMPPAGAVAHVPSPQGELSLGAAGDGAAAEVDQEEVLVTGLATEVNTARNELRVNAKFSDGDTVLVGPWAYTPTLDEIAIAIHDELDVSVEFTPAVRSSYEQAQSA